MIEVADDARHVGVSFVIRRHTAILFHASRTSVICRQSFDEIKVITFEKLAKVTRAAFHVGLRIERIGHAELQRRPWHKLHQSTGALTGYGMWVESTLGVNHAVDQIGIKAVMGARRVDEVAHTLGRKRRRYSGCNLLFFESLNRGRGYVHVAASITRCIKTGG